MENRIAGKKQILSILYQFSETENRSVGNGCNHESYIIPPDYELIADKILDESQPIPVNQDEYWKKRCEAAEKKLRNIISQLPSGDL